ncbi:hypothetical protein AOQ84DRAFT_385150 [Glonium stellatum]|uniref:Uncharacterized protein n=1 Tax=Glonium stellatum TaxID=574774 RepID=A0A8E2JYF6_9PEZI|nr:hypothetical protein AOQ84DRAFT_385150 [Glonium stellatum]
MPLPKKTFFDLPGEIRNQIYDLLIYNNLPPEFQTALKPNDPIPIPTPRAVLSLRHIARAWDAEYLSRLFAHGASLRINAIPDDRRRLELCWQTSQTRMHLRGSCPRGTTDILGSFGRSPRPYQRFDALPPRIADLWHRCELRLLLRRCSGLQRCTVCARYDWDAAAMFDFRPVLDTLVAACRASFNLPILQVVVTQEGNWLAFEGRRLLLPAVLADFVVSTEDYAGHAIERYLIEEAPDVSMTIRVITLSNSEEEDDEE